MSNGGGGKTESAYAAELNKKVISASPEPITLEATIKPEQMVSDIKD